MQIFVLVAVFFVSFLMFADVALAQTAPASPPVPGGSTNVFGLDQVAPATGLGQEDIRLVIARIIRAALGLLGIIALVLIIYAGYTIMTAGGNEEKIATGKKIIINATIGLAIILSAFAIVQFLITRLAAATGATTGVGSASLGAPSAQSFAGSGSLGRVIRDHYPFRDQKDVARNTNITVTFNEPIDPASVILDSNNNNIFGDCINTGQPNFDWNNDCDHIDTRNVVVALLDKATGNPGGALDMIALSTPEGPNTSDYLTFVFRPLSPLGSDVDIEEYQVELTGNILKADGSTSAFVNDRGGRYVWIFETGTFLDTDPPIVSSVYPPLGATVPRNTIVQINFDEPINPISVTGLAQNPGFYNIIFGDQNVTGEWKVSNSYQTVEFVPDIACGANSCGDPMYCLQITCPAANPNCSNQNHNILIRTGNLLNPGSGSFEAIPFSGVVDFADNVLDGNADGIPDGKPTMPSDTFKRIGALTSPPNEDAPDNYLWDFVVENTIDRTAPNIETISPAIDGQNVPDDVPVQINFSHPMWMGTLSGIAITEYGIPANTQPPVPPLAYRARGNLINGKTQVIVDHRLFKPNGINAYYFTSIPSTVKSVNQNCVYPGRGPVGPGGTSPQCVCNTDPVTGVVNCNANCAAVNGVRDTDTACVQAVSPGDLIQPDIQTCINRLQQLSPVI